MNKIKDLSITQLNTDLLVSSGKSLTNIARSLMDRYAIIARNVSAIEATLEAIVDIDKTEQKKERTVDIHKYDDRLDTLLPMIENGLKANIEQKEFDPVKGEASEVLLSLFKKRDRKRLFHGSYEAQGREMETLKEELFAPEFQIHRTNSGLENQLHSLDMAHVKLQTLLDERLKEGNLPTTLKDQKTVLRYRLDKLLAVIDVNIQDNVEGFPEIQTEVNELITDIMARYKALNTRKESATEE